MNSWKMKLSRISWKSRIPFFFVAHTWPASHIVGFYIFNVVYLCTDLLNCHRLYSFGLVFGYCFIIDVARVVHCWSSFSCNCFSFVRSFVRPFTHSFAVCRSMCAVRLLHSNLIAFFLSLRYTRSTTLNCRKLHIFSLFPYWMVSVMSLLFPSLSLSRAQHLFPVFSQREL